jgi:hypothetical protein
VEIPNYTSGELVLFIALAVLTTGLVLWGIWRLVKVLRQRRATLAPARIAQAELAAAARCGEDEHFAVLYSQALRRYFENGWSLACRGQSSQELLNTLGRHPRGSQQLLAALAPLLLECDAIKFARRQLESAQRDALTRSAQALVEQAEAAIKENTQEVPA